MRYGEISPFYCIEELVANPVLDGVSVPAGTSGQKEHCLGISKLSFNSTSFCSGQELHFQIFPTTILHWLYALQSNCHCQFKNTFRLNSSYQWCQLILYIYIYGSRTENRTNDKRNQTNTETSWDILKHCETLWNMQTFARHLVSISAPRRPVTSCIQLTRSLTCAVASICFVCMSVAQIP